MCTEAGYKTITPIQLWNALGAYDAEAISFRALRVYLGCFELRAIREASRRTRTAQGERRPAGECYRLGELVRLVGAVTAAQVNTALRQLERAGLLSFTENAITFTETPVPLAHEMIERAADGRKATRPIPVPRRALRFLARCRKPALVKTFIAYLIRGLSLDRKSGEVNGAGTVKASWISRIFSISERAVRAARSELIRLGWIDKDTGSKQRKLNRDGAYFKINLSWKRQEEVAQSGSDVSPAVDISPATSQRFAPPLAEKSTQFAPPLQRLETLSDPKNQKLTLGENSGFYGMKTKATLKNIQPDDLKQVGRLQELYEQAITAEWLERSEASFLNFAAAAVRANRAAGNSVRIFVGIVKKRLWHHVTGAEEDRAVASLKRYRDCGGGRSRAPNKLPDECSYRLVRELCQSCCC